ncbi:response regulator [Gemmobacter lanyuensis]
MRKTRSRPGATSSANPCAACARWWLTTISSTARFWGILTKLGLQCTMVEDGVRAVEAAVSEDFDIILLDISMPRMSGVEALQEMRRQRGRMPPVLAVTAFAMADQVQEMRRQGFDGHLGKPFSRVDLEAELLRVLEAAPAP